MVHLSAVLLVSSSAYRVSVQHERGLSGQDVFISSENEVCCVCFDESGEKTIWDIKAFDDDDSPELQGRGFMDCRMNQGDGSSKCSAHCAGIGFQMKGCLKSSGMEEWRSNEFWSALTTAGENSWTCRTDAAGSSCGCPEGAAGALVETEAEWGRRKQKEVVDTTTIAVTEVVQELVEDDSDPATTTDAMQDEDELEPMQDELVSVGSETEVCCLCFDESGPKTAWSIKTFEDDESANAQGRGFKDCRADQGDGSSKCSAHCEALGFQMKGCEKSASMNYWRQDEFWGKGFWTCSTDADGASCGCPEGAAPALVQTEAEWGRRKQKEVVDTTTIAATEVVQELVEDDSDAATTTDAMEDEDELEPMQDELVSVGSETEVCCLCFDQSGPKTAWSIKTFEDDESANAQGRGFKDCRADQGDGSSKCSAHCEALGFQMKGCEKSASMNYWRQDEFWGKGFWTCSTDADGASCGCPEGAAPALVETEAEWGRRKQKEVVETTTSTIATTEVVQELVEDDPADAATTTDAMQDEDKLEPIQDEWASVGSETEVCCLCFDESGPKTSWSIKTFEDDEFANVQGRGFKDCRADQGDGSSKCSAHCEALGFQMKGCEKSASMNYWRQDEFWGKGFWTCSTDADSASCGCP